MGYITAVETLKVVTEKSVTNTITGILEEKYKVVVPELMHETFMSDSEDEGGDENIDHQQYKYMATDDLKASEQDNQNYDTTNIDDHNDHQQQKHIQQVLQTESTDRNIIKNDRGTYLQLFNILYSYINVTCMIMCIPIVVCL